MLLFIFALKTGGKMRYTNRKNKTVGVNKSLEQYIVEFNEIDVIGASNREAVIVCSDHAVSSKTVDRWKAELKSALLKKAIIFKKVYKGNKKAYENSSDGVFLDGLIQINSELLEKYIPNDGVDILKYKSREVY